MVLLQWYLLVVKSTLANQNCYSNYHIHWPITLQLRGQSEFFFNFNYFFFIILCFFTNLIKIHLIIEDSVNNQWEPYHTYKLRPIFKY